MTIDEKQLREFADEITDLAGRRNYDAVRDVTMRMVGYIRANTTVRSTKPKIEPCPVCGHLCWPVDNRVVTCERTTEGHCSYGGASVDAHNKLSRENQFVAAVLNHRSVNPVWVNDLLREKGLLP